MSGVWSRVASWAGPPTAQSGLRTPACPTQVPGEGEIGSLR